MSNKKQTAVEWLRQEVLKRDMDISIKELYVQAKAMEKNDKMNFANWCRIYDKNHPNEVNTIQQLFTKYYEQ
jgi:hypothetical protein